MMRWQGVLYDAGRVMGGVTWRPDYSPALARRELEIISTGLHCNAVRIWAPGHRAAGRRGRGTPPPAGHGRVVLPGAIQRVPGCDAAPPCALGSGREPPRDCGPGGRGSLSSASAVS